MQNVAMRAQAPRCYPSIDLPPEDIADAQRLLNEIHQSCLVRTDGVMDADTARALSEFQRGERLIQTGVPDAPTMGRLRERAACTCPSGESGSRSDPIAPGGDIPTPTREASPFGP